MTLEFTYDYNGVVRLDNHEMHQWNVAVTGSVEATAVRFDYHMGMALDGPPTDDDVIESLASDIGLYDEYGDDLDAWVADGLYDLSGDRPIARLTAQVADLRRMVGALRRTGIADEIIARAEAINA